MLEQAHDLLTYIEAGRNNNFYKATTDLFAQIGTSVVSIGDIFDKYTDFIFGETIKVRLTDSELVKYRYRPKQLSKDLYGTEELWTLLLKLNNIGTEIHFNKQAIRILDPESKILSKIINIEKDTIRDNRNNY